MNARSPLALAALAALLCTACGAGRPPASDAKVKLSLKASTVTPRSGLVAVPALCADFTLTPRSLSGGVATDAGSPIHVSSSLTGGTLAIAGCMDSSALTDPPTNDWSYLVTANNFHPCDGSTLPDNLGVSPQVVTTTYDFDCRKGIDVVANVVVDVSVAVPNAGGYVDIAVSVNAQQVEVGCKEAAFDDPANPASLHFGESYTWNDATPFASAPDGLWGVSADSHGAALAPAQWSGQVFSGSLHDQYYTGAVTLAEPARIVQTFIPGGCTALFSASSQPACLTSATPAANGAAASATTVATLFNAFSASASGWAGAIITDPSTVAISAALTTTSIPAGAQPMAHAPALQDTLQPQVDFSVPGLTFTGIWPYLGGLGFVATVLDGATPGYVVITQSATHAWTVTEGPTPLSGKPTSYLTCLGLFATTTTCAAPTSCAPKFHPTAALGTARAFATATLLQSGKVLIAGGLDDTFSTALRSAELYDPATNTFSPTAGSLNGDHVSASATLLPDGRVLIAAGADSSFSPQSGAEIFDPATGLFTATGSLANARYDHTATLVQGKVLVVGGVISQGSPVHDAELFDPAAGTFGPLTHTITGLPFSNSTATLLQNGADVLVAGGTAFTGTPTPAALYSGSAGDFTMQGLLAEERLYASAALLQDGRVLIAGGIDSGFASPIASAELYSPATGAFTLAGPMAAARNVFTATRLASGQVIAVGGMGLLGIEATAELFDPATATFSPAANLITGRYFHTATLLNDGRLLVTGGVSDAGVEASAELYY